MPFLENIATDVFVKPTAAHPFNYWPMHDTTWPPNYVQTIEFPIQKLRKIETKSCFSNDATNGRTELF